ncbi:methyltransferase type 11 [Halobacteriales archaeon QS_1_68_20]|nr:MAG: methyltransferase type 11 [Halobacteriales archaeon QS_1_68_20]
MADRPRTATNPTENLPDGPSLDELREAYAATAERRTRPPLIDRLLKSRYRRQHFGQARGRVLDVACGLGTNYRYLPDSVEYVGVDTTREMLETTKDRFNGLGTMDALAQMDVVALAFPDDAFDTVVSSFSTCAFPDPVAAIREMGRVCAPDGRILLLEHGRSDVELLGRLQDWRVDTELAGDVCRWSQDPVANVRRAGLTITETRSWLAGIVTAIEARPP